MPLVSNDGLGYGQTSQNVTGSRAFATTYQNTTGKPIFVNITFSGAAGIYPWIDGVAKAQIGNAGSGSSTIAQCSIIIPIGASYAFSSSNSVLQSTGMTLAGWNELR